MSRKDPTTKAGIRAERAEHSAMDFADHVLVQETPTLWRCAKPGTGIYAFRVAELPGAILVYGDIGEMLLLPGHGRTVRNWLMGSIRSEDYVLEKLPQPRQRYRKFYPALAEVLLQEFVDRNQPTPDAGEEAIAEYLASEERLKRVSIAEEIREQASSYADDDGEGFNRAWYDCHPDGDSEALEQVWYWDQDVLWCYEALKWFCDALRRSEEANVPVPAAATTGAAEEKTC